MAFSTSRTQGNSFQSTSRVNQDLDKIITGDIACDSLAVSGATTMTDVSLTSIAVAVDVGATSDGVTRVAKHMQLGQTSHATGSIWDASSSEHVQCLLGGDHGLSDIHDDSVPRCKLLLTGLNNEDIGSGTFHIFCEDENANVDFTVKRESNTANDSHVFCQNLEIPDGGSLYLGDSNDLRLTHNGTDSFIQDSGTGNLNIRTNGTHIGISDTTSSTNYMAKFVKDAAVELFFNKVKKLETSATGVTVTGDIQTTNTIVASGSGWATAASITPKFSIINAHTRATFLIDLGEGAFSSASGTVIGENNSNPSFITRFTEATYGLIYRVFMVCLEPLAGGESDIDVSVSTSSLTRGQNTGIGVIINGGTQQTETTYLQFETGGGSQLEDKYLYLTTGAGSNTNAYTAGKLLVVIEGYKL